MYTPLYIKTDYSIMSSLIKIDDLIRFAKEFNIKALAVADDNMCYALPFYEACIKEGIKPIIGLEYKKDDINVALFAKDYDGYKKRGNF